MPVVDSALMRRALEYARMFRLPVIVHEEDPGLCCGAVMHEGRVSVRLGLKGMPSAGESVMVARDIELVRTTGGRLHIAHISCGESVEMVRRAKAEGLDVTAEAAPHHFMLDDTAVFQNQYVVGALHGTQAMGDDDSGTAVQQPVNRALQKLFGRRV